MAAGASPHPSPPLLSSSQVQVSEDQLSFPALGLNRLGLLLTVSGAEWQSLKSPEARASFLEARLVQAASRSPQQLY